MHRWNRWVAATTIMSMVVLAGCAQTEEEEPTANAPARVEAIEGSDLVRVILTAKAAERVDIQSDAVQTASGKLTVIPYAALFYTADGATWTYTIPEPLTYVRAPVAIDHVKGDLVYLSDGPTTGTSVVTQGAAELYGTETGVEE